MEYVSVTITTFATKAHIWPNMYRFTNRPYALDRRFKSFSNMPIIVRQYKNTA